MVIDWVAMLRGGTRSRLAMHICWWTMLSQVVSMCRCSLSRMHMTAAAHHVNGTCRRPAVGRPGRAAMAGTILNKGVAPCQKQNRMLCTFALSLTPIETMVMPAALAALAAASVAASGFLLGLQRQTQLILGHQRQCGRWRASTMLWHSASAGDMPSIQWRPARLREQMHIIHTLCQPAGIQSSRVSSQCGAAVGDQDDDSRLGFVCACQQCSTAVQSRRGVCALPLLLGCMHLRSHVEDSHVGGKP